MLSFYLCSCTTACGLPAQCSGSAAGRAADRPLQPVVMPRRLEHLAFWADFRLDEQFQPISRLVQLLEGIPDLRHELGF